MLPCTLSPPGTPSGPIEAEPDRPDPPAPAGGEIGGRSPATDRESADEPTLDQVLAAYWQATAPTQPGPLGGWAASLAPGRVGAPALDGYWTSTADRPRLSPADAAAWTARIHHAAEREPLHLPSATRPPHPQPLWSHSPWRTGHRGRRGIAMPPDPRPLGAAEDREPTPADLITVTAELPTLLGELATALLAELPDQAEAVAAAADLYRLAADLGPAEPPLPDSVANTTSERNPWMTLPATFDPRTDPSNLPPHSAPTRGIHAEPDPLREPPPAESARRRHAFTPAEDARITQAVAAAAPRQLGTALAALAEQLGLTFAQVQYRMQYLARPARAGRRPAEAAPAGAGAPAEIPAQVESPLPAGAAGDAPPQTGPPAGDFSPSGAPTASVAATDLPIATTPGSRDLALPGHAGVP